MKLFFKASGVLQAALALLLVASTANAQQGAGSLQYKADKITVTQTGVKLIGNAEIIAKPQLEARAQSISFNFSGSQITEVSANGKVVLKVSLTPKGGGKMTRVETTSDSALLKPQTRELTLTGNVDGFFQPEGQSRTTLAGTKVEMKYVGQFLEGVIAGPIQLSIPAETVNMGAGSTPGAAIGAITITAREAKIDGKAGVVRFVGNAHAVSEGGPNKFDVAASEFILTRSANNSIDTLKTGGRTQIKIDLPPEPAAPGAASKIGRPTRVEATADSAVVSRLTNTLTFDGNVNGFYYLAPAEGAPQKYDFVGNKAVIRYVPQAQATADAPAGLKADITGTPGKPVEFSAPAFNIDLGN